MRNKEDILYETVLDAVMMYTGNVPSDILKVDAAVALANTFVNVLFHGFNVPHSAIRAEFQKVIELSEKMNCKQQSAASHLRSRDQRLKK